VHRCRCLAAGQAVGCLRSIRGALVCELGPPRLCVYSYISSALPADVQLLYASVWPMSGPSQLPLASLPGFSLACLHSYASSASVRVHSEQVPAVTYKIPFVISMCLAGSRRQHGWPSTNKMLLQQCVHFSHTSIRSAPPSVTSRRAAGHPLQG
jgi:hypothetical protein